jgi:hypothetical protein
MLIDISSLNVNLITEFVLLLLIIAVCDELELFVARDTKASHRAMNNFSFDVSSHEKK